MSVTDLAVKLLEQMLREFDVFRTPREDPNNSYWSEGSLAKVGLKLTCLSLPLER